MPAKVAWVVKAGAALLTLKRLLARVGSQVDLQAAVLGEAPPALATHVRLLARVDALVDGQRGLTDKRLGAEGAAKGRLPAVCRPV